MRFYFDKKWWLSFFCVVGSGVICFTFADDRLDGKQYPVYLKFVNSRTGVATAVDGVRVVGKAQSFQSEENGLMEIRVPGGTHKIKIESKRFHPMELSVRVEGEQTPVQEVELDPVGEDEAPAVDADTAVVMGTIIDRDTSLPIDGAIVRVQDNDSVTTKSMGDGFFHLSIKIPKLDAEEVPVASFRFEAKGYVTESMRNIILAGGDSRRMTVGMDRLTTGGPALRETDEVRERIGSRVYNWVFDATVE